MRTTAELFRFLVDYLFESLIPTGLLLVAWLMGLLPCSWPWAVLPTVSAVFFLGSYLLAGAIAKTAFLLAKPRS